MPSRLLAFALAAAIAFTAAAGFGASVAWNRYAASLGPLDLAASREGSTIVVDRDGRLLQAFYPSGRALASAGDHARRRSALPRDAYRLRGRALLRARRGRHSRPRSRRRAMADARPCGLRRLDLTDAGRAADRAQARAHDRRQTAPDRARAGDRARGRKEGNARPLSHARAVRRQPRRRAGGLARLFRQGAAEAHPCRDGAPGRAAAIAGSAQARSFADSGARGARPRARPRRCARSHQRSRRRRGQARTGSSGAPGLSGARRARRRGSGRRRPPGQGHQALDRCAPARQA